MKIKYTTTAGNYRSADGRFFIERREYDMPRVETCWMLYDNGKRLFQHDTLRDAKEEAADIVADEAAQQ